jgi:DNA-binding MarR family transcriptional regulator
VTVLEERGVFWWHHEPIPENCFAPQSSVPGLLKISDDGAITLDLDGYFPSDKGAWSVLPDMGECKGKIIEGILRATDRRVILLDLAPYGGRFATSGLRTTQFSILAKLKRLGPLTINALARDMVMDRTTLGRNILPLERDGLIRIEATTSDRRAKELHLTKAGEKRLQAANKAWSQAQARFETMYGPRRAADLRSMLRAVVATDFEAHAPGSRTNP